MQTETDAIKPNQQAGYDEDSWQAGYDIGIAKGKESEWVSKAALQLLWEQGIKPGTRELLDAYRRFVEQPPCAG